jgi:hypothetical protein
MPLAHRQCTCGFICAVDEKFCGRCGSPLGINEISSQNPMEKRLNLEQIMAAAVQDENLSDAQKVRVNQEDIRKLLASRKRKPK